ncbi:MULTISPECIES: DUF6326 family protein [Pseudoalteromonas]|uniref:DUF6326 family protein n=1 Tax=Pseudoalteromonas TaxID=53246 RepID=UPI000FFF16EE|nr:MULTISPECIES: DUF6326 family protein [Pseudoalteromonas]MCG9760212.1 DUF6326 family protein [Pseudoalteromonas sp. Isolate6]NKC21355.1 hypothetical protein [Pseudoalteromonas galatheae]RXE85890.1 hypothetical protein DRB05_13230 [Pseudoalteromonas sp. A757]
MTTAAATGQSTHSANTHKKVATLWLLVMLNMIYADILAFVSAFITPGVIETLMTGYSGSVKLSQPLLLISAILIEIPIAMIFLSQYLNYHLNRACNLVAVVLTFLFILGGVETDPFYLFLVAIQLSLLLTIAWTVIRWRMPHGSNQYNAINE